MLVPRLNQTFEGEHYFLGVQKLSRIANITVQWRGLVSPSHINRLEASLQFYLDFGLVLVLHCHYPALRLRRVTHACMGAPHRKKVLDKIVNWVLFFYSIVTCSQGCVEFLHVTGKLPNRKVVDFACVKQKL